ncbi:MobF family relaxase [Nocardiopsis sp. NPDC050513]|uniref:MobF family relaxase n=1 Tax=Nocardiopsis sp. NPDC050513 TaxID=3364338 RepID=UPI003788964E
MAWLTVLGPSAEQVEYRLSERCGCDQTATAEHDDAVVDYRIQGADRAITRIGSGWAEFGHTSGEALRTKADLDTVRAVMAGADPRSGEELVAPKRAVDPRATLAASPLVEAVGIIAEAAHLTPAQLLARSDRSAERFARLVRGLARDGDAHRAPVKDLSAIATAAGVDLEVLYDHQELATARDHADAKVRIGNRGYDLVLNMPKSVSVLYGLADPAMAARIEELYLRAVRETVAGVEAWCAYGVSGHHGGGRAAERVDSSGLIGSVTLHRSARPVGGQVGDPHIHAHVMLANMVRCADGQWRTVASGGRDLHRHVQAAGELAKARVRELLAAELGVVWQRCQTSGEWEIAGIDADVRGTFSRRAGQVKDAVGKGASAAAQRAHARKSAHAKQDVSQSDLRTAWAKRAVAARIDPVRLVAGALGRGWDGPAPAAGSGGGPPHRPGPPDVDALAAAVWDPQTGVTANSKTTTRAKVLAAVANACPTGVGSAVELQALADAVLAHPRAVRLPDQGNSHLSHTDRYTSLDLVQAERAVVAAARRRRAAGAAVVERGVSSAALKSWCEQKGFAVSAEQLAVIVRLVEDGHGLDMVQGVAGAGKTSIMSAARCVWEAAGYRVQGAAVAAVAAEGLRAEAGIASRTVASWLRRITDGPGLEGVDVLVVDEAGMIADRDLALLVVEADRTGTKIAGIGDSQQLRAVGAGGAFARIHQLLEGPTLTENRRQRGDLDRRALRTWREGGRGSALALWAQNGMVHAPADLDLAYGQMAAAWWNDRQAFLDAPGGAATHEVIDQLLMLAATNDAVTELNTRARAIARTEGLLTGDDVVYRTVGGGTVAMAPGDQVRVTRNDYRSRRDPDSPDVLNGYRGVVLDVDLRQGALIQWRTHDGQHERAWMDPAQVARGDLVHAYAITIAAAQGLTSQRCHVLGYGADAHSLYPAMSRAKERTDLYLPAAELEPEQVRLRLGQARTPQEGLHRVVSAYAATLTDTPETMVIDELDEVDVEIAPAAATGRQGGTRPEHQEPDEHERLAAQSAALVRRANEMDADLLPTLREELRLAEDRATQGRMRLLMEGTTPAAARAVVQAAHDRLDEALKAVRGLRGEAAALSRQAEQARHRLEREHARAAEHQRRQRDLDAVALDHGLTRSELHALDEGHQAALETSSAVRPAVRWARAARLRQAKVTAPPTSARAAAGRRPVPKTPPPTPQETPAARQTPESRRAGRGPKP